MKLKDWNEAHIIKEQIEKEYPVFVHIIGRGCIVTTNDPKLLENNKWNDCIAMTEPSPDEIENIKGLEWAEKTFNLFFEKIKTL